jgi:CopA family copper-resistance protein
MFGPVVDDRRAASGITRRRFVQGLVAAGVVGGFDLSLRPLLAGTTPSSGPVLSGNHFDLTVEETPVNFTGRHAVATAVNGLVPGPLLRWREGDPVTIAVTNRLHMPTSIHWHGIRTPSDMDGVPGLSFPGIAPGQRFVYRFPVEQSGTYWYHSHSGFEEQTGLYGALIIDPKGEDPIRYDREYVIVLSDWTDDNPETILSNLKQQSDYYNYHQRTVGTFFADVRRNGLSATVSDRLMWGRMNMGPTDLSDVSAATYTYLVNGHPPAANWTALFEPKQRVRLRVINASSMTIFDVRIPNLPMTVVQADGNDVEPVTVDEFRISVAETYDVIVQPQEASAFTIFAQPLDRSGYARATLAPRSGMAAPVPALDPRPLLTMVDMGMGTMSGMEMGKSASETMKHDEMPGMKMASNPLANPASVAAKLSGYRGTPFPQPGPDDSVVPAPSSRRAMTPPAPVVLHEGPQVDNLAKAPTERLTEPGIGLNNNGRRVLTYADLRARYRGSDPRPPSREIEIHLTGNMERYVWGFDGEKFSAAEPIRLTLGERVRFILVNDTMMAHPIHLHGLWSELENGHGDLRPYKHTINVKPGERLSYLISADTPGRWAYHCHLAFHMEAGMFREVLVA